MKNTCLLTCIHKSSGGWGLVLYRTQACCVSLLRGNSAQLCAYLAQLQRDTVHCAADPPPPTHTHSRTHNRSCYTQQLKNIQMYSSIKQLLQLEVLKTEKWGLLTHRCFPHLQKSTPPLALSLSCCCTLIDRAEQYGSVRVAQTAGPLTSSESLSSVWHCPCVGSVFVLAVLDGGGSPAPAADGQSLRNNSEITNV